MFEKIEFKNQELEQGDIVTMIAGSFPFEFQAAIVNYDVKTDTLEVMSTQLVVTRHSGLFLSNDIEKIEVVRKFNEGLPTEARADLKRGQLCLVSGEWQAIVTAAFDGMVTGQSVDTPGVMDGTPISGGSAVWQAV